MTETSSKTGLKPLVMGIGSKFRGDDEIGLMVVEALGEKEGVGSFDISLHSDDSARIMLDWQDRPAVVIVDAVRSGEIPGTICRFDVANTNITPHSRASSHGNALGDAIELARQLNSLPNKIVVIGIEPETTKLGDAISDTCLAKMDELNSRLEEELRCMNLL
jgi:hydrogenase maturation protease